MCMCVCVYMCVGVWVCGWVYMWVGVWVCMCVGVGVQVQIQVWCMYNFVCGGKARVHAATETHCTINHNYKYTCI